MLQKGKIFFKNFMKKIGYFLVEHNGIVWAYALFFLFIIVSQMVNAQVHLGEIIELQTLFTFSVTFLLNFGVLKMNKYFKALIEDDMKLTNNYDLLVKRYNGEALLNYENEIKTPNSALYEKIHHGQQIKTTQTRFPILVECNNLPHYEIQIADSTEQFQLDDEIKEHYTELWNAHDSSNIYNQLNVRVDEWELGAQSFIIHTSRTTYYDSLVTNRAMDYKWSNGLNIRDKYQYGPFFKRLSQSPLSNHLGFNGLVESKDGFIPFILRKGDVSIGKGTYGTSVGASLKAKYALNNQMFTREGLRNAMVQEIKDEIKIDVSDIFDVNQHVIAAYRDILEGGKPQLLFYVKVSKDRNEIDNIFYTIMKSKILKEKAAKKDKELKELEDGFKLSWIHKDDLRKAYITSNGFVAMKQTKEGGKKVPMYHQMLPSASASIVMVLKYWEKHN